MMSDKTLDTLVEDIYDVFSRPHKVDEGNLRIFVEQCTEAIREAVEKAGSEEDNKFRVRMSNIGTPLRKLWFLSRRNPDDLTGTPMPSDLIKFCYGHILEAFLLFLAREAGHDVEDGQRTVEISGVEGHMDAVIDGVVVDVKSASPASFDKFKNGELLQGKDPFGYIDQISGYTNALGKDRAAFLAINKVSGELSVLPVESFFLSNTEERIERINEALERDAPPEELCYPDKPSGKSGNRELESGCVYCPFKFKCWKDLRVFQYSNGPKYLTRVEVAPRVPEVTDAYVDTMGKDSRG